MNRQLNKVNNCNKSTKIKNEPKKDNLDIIHNDDKGNLKVNKNIAIKEKEKIKNEDVQHFRFNFKEFLESFNLHQMNIRNRNLNDSVNPNKLKELYEKFVKESDELNLMRKKLNEIKNR